MRKFKQYLMLFSGIIVILLGIILPITYFNQSTYYIAKEDISLGKITYELTIHSNRDLNIDKCLVTVEFLSGQIEEQEAQFLGHSLIGDEYTANFVLRLDNFGSVQELTVEIIGNERFEVQEKYNDSSKLPTMLISSLIGAVMIIMFFVTKGAHKAEEIENEGNATNSLSTPQQHEHKTCEYCGSSVNADETVCSSCGARMKM
jgi:hypothetical protein